MLVLMIAAVLPWLQFPIHAAGPMGSFKPEELVCRMDASFSIDTVNNVFGTTVKGFVQQTGCYLLKTRPGQNAESLAVLIGESPGVQYCGANYFLDAPEPFQRSQPFLDLDCTGDYETQLAAGTLNLAEVQTITDGSGIKVAVIDCGVDLDHPEFVTRSGAVYSGWDYVDNDSIANDETGGGSSGHGTFVAGVIRLVAPACDIYAYRVLDTLGRGDGYNVTRALVQAIQDGCKIINLSLGMIGRHEGLDDALKYAENQDITVVASAGNDSTESDFIFPFPAKKTSCLTVAALDSVNIRADFSNYGHKIDICAPGTKIYCPFPDALYAWWDGTSFAAPFITGLAALLYSVDSNLNREEVVYLMESSAINIDSLNPGLQGKLGYGLVNMPAALQFVNQLSCGDVDACGSIFITDVTFLTDFLFRYGAPPYPYGAGDVDCSGDVNVADLTYLVAYLFLSGPTPCEGCP